MPVCVDLGTEVDDLGLDWGDERELYDEELSTLHAQIQLAVDRGVKVILIDFDNTLVSLHTAGSFHGPVSVLTDSIRPIFKELIQYAQANGVKMAVASFSTQPCLIKQALLLGGISGVDVLAGRRQVYLVCGETQDTLKPTLVADQVKGPHKMKHLSAACELFQVDRSEVLLIDDDKPNVQQCQLDGAEAVWFDPDSPYKLDLEL